MKSFQYIIIGKRTILCVGLSLIVAFFGVFCGAGWNKTLTTTANTKKLPIYCTQTTKKQIAISFDAAWGNEDTGQLIDILAKHNIKTTFFVVGEWVDKYPESVKALSNAGHEIMNHSDSHPHMPQLSIEQMTEEINSCNDKIEKITNRRPTLFRAPFGEYDNSLIDTLSSMNMFCIQWSIDSRDWKEDYTTEKIVNGVVNNVKSGDIVLFHNAAKNTPEALPIILQKLISDGYEILPISKLIMTNNFTINHEGRQIENTQAKSQLSK